MSEVTSPPISSVTDPLLSPTRLEPPENFCFECGHLFRRSYLAAGPQARFVLDLQRTRQIDTAALGMLLQLEEYVRHDPQRLQVVNASPELGHLLEIAGLGAYLS